MKLSDEDENLKKKSCSLGLRRKIADDRTKLGRKTHVIDCRETPGIGFGGGFAQRGTLSKSEINDVLILSMGPTKRHITKPVCEITYALRENDIETSVYVLKAGIGPPATVSEKNIGGVGSISGITEKEIEIMKDFKLLLIHLGNVPRHFVHKAKLFLEKIELPAIVVCQAPVIFSDFEKIDIKTIEHPENQGTIGKIVDLVTGVIRGQSVPQDKIEEIVAKVKKHIREKLK